MKKSLILTLTIVFCMVSFAVGQDKGVQAKPEPCQYTGTIEKLESPNRLTINSEGTQESFLYTHDGKGECLSWEKLALGENVTVMCKEKKEVMEATCVTKKPSGATFQGGTMQGGTIK
jgi:hypothetical protein